MVMTPGPMPMSCTVPSGRTRSWPRRRKSSTEPSPILLRRPEIGKDGKGEPAAENHRRKVAEADPELPRPIPRQRQDEIGHPIGVDRLPVMRMQRGVALLGRVAGKLGCAVGVELQLGVEIKLAAGKDREELWRRRENLIDHPRLGDQFGNAAQDRQRRRARLVGRGVRHGSRFFGIGRRSAGSRQHKSGRLPSL